jgi:hypothetical protein
MQGGISRVDIYKYCCSLGMQQTKDNSGALDHFFASRKVYLNVLVRHVIINRDFPVNVSKYTYDEVYNVFDPASGKMHFIYCANGALQDNSEIWCSEASFTKFITVKPDLTPGLTSASGQTEQSYTTPFANAFVCE